MRNPDPLHSLRRRPRPAALVSLTSLTVGQNWVSPPPQTRSPSPPPLPEHTSRCLVAWLLRRRSLFFFLGRFRRCRRCRRCPPSPAASSSSSSTRVVLPRPAVEVVVERGEVAAAAVVLSHGAATTSNSRASRGSRRVKMV